MRSVRASIVPLLVSCLMLGACGQPADGESAEGPPPAAGGGWPQWRGPNRDGHSGEASGYPQGWPPKRLWSKKVGYGCTSPILYGGKLYVMGWSGRGGRRPRRADMGTDTIYCFDAVSGRELWKQSYKARYQSRQRTGDTSQYGGPSSTPALDVASGHLFTLGVDGDLQCWDTNAGGKRVWGFNLLDKYPIPRRPSPGGGQRDFGFTGSPLLQGDRVLVEVGSTKGTVMAFEKATGRQVWASEYRKAAGHSAGPVPMKVLGRDALAVLTLHRLVVMRNDPGNEGKTLATFDWRTDYACNLPTPAAIGNRLIVTSAYNRRRTAMLEVSSAGVREKWQSKRYALLSSPTIHRGNIYLVQDGVTCLSLSSGRQRWRGGSFGHGSALVTADNKLLVFGKGRLALLDAQPANGKYTELAHIAGLVRGTCYPHVALADGVIAVKDRDGNLVCLSVKKRG